MGYLWIKLKRMECEGEGKIYDGQNWCIQGFGWECRAGDNFVDLGIKY